MKSKISLIILLVVIVFLGALSFFLGYKYFGEKDTVKALNSQIEILKNEQAINEQNSSNTENGVSQVVENLTIPKFDSSKVEGNLSSVQEQGRLETIGEAQVAIGNRDTLGNKSKQVFRYKNVNYTFGENGGPEIIDVIYGIYGNGGTYYYAVLLENGTVQYAIEGASLEFKSIDIDNIVRIIELRDQDSNGIIFGRLGVITGDGVTHVVEF